MNSWTFAAFGGVLIGSSAVLLLLLCGRLAGISGIVGGLLQRCSRDEWVWRTAFIVGLMLCGGVAMHLLEQATPSPASTPVLVIAGLLVGYGTSLGSGCTSGHGVCGLGRLSSRSFVAVLVFVLSAMLTVFLFNTLAGAP